MVATGWQWVANKRHPQVTGERCFPCPPHFHLQSTHEKRRKSVKKARVCSAEMLYPHQLSLLFHFWLQLPAAVWEMDLSLGKQQQGVGVEYGMFFELGPFCPSIQNRQTVGSLCAAFDWRFSWRPPRETLGRRFLNMVGLWAPGFQRGIE